MAFIYKDQPGRRAGTQYVVAQNEGVQAWLDEFIFEAGVRAEMELKEHRAEGHSFIEIDKGDIDRNLILSDENGDQAALSIEFGREPYMVERDDGSVYEVPGMEGLFILHHAVGIPDGMLDGTGGGTI